VAQEEIMEQLTEEQKYNIARNHLIKTDERAANKCVFYRNAIITAYRATVCYEGANYTRLRQYFREAVALYFPGKVSNTELDEIAALVKNYLGDKGRDGVMRKIGLMEHTNYFYFVQDEVGPKWTWKTDEVDLLTLPHPTFFLRKVIK